MASHRDLLSALRRVGVSRVLLFGRIEYDGDLLRHSRAARCEPERVRRATRRLPPERGRALTRCAVTTFPPVTE